MASRVFNVSFRINGAMDGSLQAALNAAANAMRRLGNSARAASAAAQASRAGLSGMAAGLNQLQAAAQKFRELKKTLGETRTGLSEAQSAANSMAAKYRQDAAAVEKLRQELSRLVAARKQAEGTLNGNRSELDYLRRQRQELSQRARDLGAKGFDKIPRALLGTRQGSQLGEVLLQLKANQAALDSARQKFKANRDELNLLVQKIRETERALKSQENVARQSGKGFEEAKAKAASLKATLQQQQEALQRLRTALGSQGFSTTNFAASERQLAAEINRVNELLRQQEALSAASARTRAAFTNVGLAAAGFMGSVYSAQQAMSPFTTATKKAVEFERVMSEVKALTQMDNIKAGKFDVVERDMARIKAQAKELGATTIYTAQQVGEAQAYIARTGWDTNQVLASTPIFLKLAASQHMDLARTADIATNVMTGFGHTMASVGNDAKKFAQLIQHDADVFAYTVTHSNQTFEQFGEAMKYAAPVAKNFGATIEETAMMTKFMGDAGIQGSMAGTSMRQTMLRLVAPPKRATKAMQQYGITLDDANAAWQNSNAVAQEYGVVLDENLSVGRQFINVMRQIDKNMVGASDREKLGALSAITGINAVSGAMNIFGAGANQAENFTELLEKCDGALEQTYQIMTDNTYGAAKSFESAWEAVQLSIGEALLPAVRGLYEAFTPLLTSFSQFIDRNQGLVVAIAGTVAALSGLMVAAAGVRLAFAGWGFIAATFAELSKAAMAFRLGMAGIAVEGGAISTLFAGLGMKFAGVATLIGAIFGAGLGKFSGWKNLFVIIATKAQIAATAVRSFAASLTLSSVASGAASAIKGVAAAIRTATLASLSFVFSPIGAALMALALAGLYCYQNWDKVSPALEKIASIVTGALGPAMTSILQAVDSINKAFSILGSNSTIQEFISLIGGTLVQAVVAAAGAIATILAVIIRGVADTVKIIADLGAGLAKAFDKLSEGDFSGAMAAMSDTGQKAAYNIENAFNHAYDTIKTGWKATSEAIDLVETGKRSSVKSVLNKGLKAREAAFKIEQPAAEVQQTVQQEVQYQLPPEIQAQFPPEAVAQYQSAMQQAPPAQAVQTVEQAAPTAAPTPQQPAIDTAKLQASFDAAGTAAQNASTQLGNIGQGIETGMQGVTTATTATGTAFQVTGAAVVTTGVAFQVVGAIILTTGAATQMLGAAMLATGAAVQAFGAAALGACAGTSALGTAAGSAATAVSSLGTAAQAACSQLAAAGANAAAQVSAAAASVGKPAANYQGGIYRKGAFLTTFAEKSAEAAIPLDGSSRAINLWTRAGEMLGILPQTQSPTFDPTITSPPFNPDIKLPDGKQIYSGTAQLPTRDETRRQKLPEIFTAPPKLPERIQRPKPQAKLPKLNFPTTTPPFVPTENQSSTLGNVFAKIGGALLDKIQSSKFGQILGNIFPTGVDQTTRWSPYQSTFNLPTARPTFNPKLTTPPFVPENNDASPIAKLHETLAKPSETLYRDDAPINIEINVTVHGNADEQTVKRGVEQAMPTIRNFADELRQYKHERARVSFA